MYAELMYSPGHFHLNTEIWSLGSNYTSGSAKKTKLV